MEYHYQKFNKIEEVHFITNTTAVDSRHLKVKDTE